MSAPRITPFDVGDYRCQRQLGSGLTGLVFVAVNRVTGQQRAVKRVRRELVETPSAVERLMAAADASRRLHHPGIVQVAEVIQENSDLYIVSEYVPGTNLARVFSALRDEPLAPVEAVWVARMVASGLAFAHQQQLVHGSLWPQNVLVGWRGEIKLTDFGSWAASRSSHGGASVRSQLAYRAPEHLDDGPLTPATDVFGVAVLLLELLTGRPTTGIDPVADDRGLSTLSATDPGLGALLRRAISSDASRRPVDAAALLDELEALMPEATEPTLRDRVTERLGFPRRSEVDLPALGEGDEPTKSGPTGVTEALRTLSRVTTDETASDGLSLDVGEREVTTTATETDTESVVRDGKYMVRRPRGAPAGPTGPLPIVLDDDDELARTEVSAPPAMDDALPPIDLDSLDRSLLPRERPTAEIGPRHKRQARAIAKEAAAAAEAAPLGPGDGGLGAGFDDLTEDHALHAELPTVDARPQPDGGAAEPLGGSLDPPTRPMPLPPQPARHDAEAAESSLPPVLRPYGPSAVTPLPGERRPDDLATDEPPPDDWAATDEDGSTLTPPPLGPVPAAQGQLQFEESMVSLDDTGGSISAWSDLQPPQPPHPPGWRQRLTPAHVLFFSALVVFLVALGLLGRRLLLQRSAPAAVAVARDAGGLPSRVDGAAPSLAIDSRPSSQPVAAAGDAGTEAAGSADGSVAKSGDAGIAGAPVLEVSSEPAGAYVFVDGKRLGKTPLKRAVEAGASLRVAVIASRRKIFRVQKEVPAAGSLVITAKLPPARPPRHRVASGLRIRCLRGDRRRIFIEGKDTGLTCPRASIRLRPGRYTVGFYDVHDDETRTVRVRVRRRHWRRLRLRRR